MGEPITFEHDGARLRVRDAVMDTVCTFTASGTLDPYAVSSARFLFPVDAAVSIETASLSLPANAGVVVRHEDGRVASVLDGGEVSVPRGTYYVEVNTRCKCYLKVFDAAVEAETALSHGRDATTLTFDDRTRVAVGARSVHERPSATVTVPDTPAGLREALPYLASSVKEWSCERSWPTLRGHPPRFERGADLSVPDALSKPDTGVVVAVPETYDALYTVAPLAYYLGADVVSADAPELRLDNGFVEPLDGGDGLAARCAELLGRCLFLDTLVRVGGYYSFARQEYEAVAGDLPFYPPELYGESLSGQLMEYLEVPKSALDAVLPDPAYEGVLRPTPGDARLLPYLVYRLAPVTTSATRDAGARTAAVTGYSTPPVPAGGTRLSVAGFEHALSDPPRGGDEVSTVLLGVGGRARETLSAVSTDRGGDGPLDVRETVTTDDARDALTGDHGFVHVGAPLTRAGFVCEDGLLDPDAIDDVGARMVSVVGDLETAGRALDGFVERGATAGVAFESVDRRTVGRVAGRLLSGAPLAQSVAWADTDASCRLSGHASASAVVRTGTQNVVECRVRSESPSSHHLTIRTWWVPNGVPGGVTQVLASHVVQQAQLNGATVGHQRALTAAEVADVFNERDSVYVLNDVVYQHEDEVTAADVRESARRALAGETARDTGEQF